MAVSTNAIRKAGHRACLREMTGKPSSFMPLSAIFHARHFKVHFSVARSKGFRSKNEKKKLQRYKVSSAGKSLYVICGNYLHILGIIIAQNVPRVVVFKVIIFIIK